MLGSLEDAFTSGRLKALVLRRVFFFFNVCFGIGFCYAALAASTLQ